MGDPRVISDLQDQLLTRTGDKLVLAGPVQIQHDSSRAAGVHAHAQALYTSVAHGNTSRGSRQQSVWQVYNQPVRRRKRLDLGSNYAPGRHFDADAAIAT